MIFPPIFCLLLVCLDYIYCSGHYYTSSTARPPLVVSHTHSGLGMSYVTITGDFFSQGRLGVEAIAEQVRTELNQPT